MYIHTCTYIHMYTYIYIYVYTYTYMYIYTYVNIYIYIYIYICWYVEMLFTDPARINRTTRPKTCCRTATGRIGDHVTTGEFHRFLSVPKNGSWILMPISPLAKPRRDKRTVTSNRWRLFYYRSMGDSIRITLYDRPTVVCMCKLSMKRVGIVYS